MAILQAEPLPKVNGPLARTVPIRKSERLQIDELSGMMKIKGNFAERIGPQNWEAYSELPLPLSLVANGFIKIEPSPKYRR